MPPTMKSNIYQIKLQQIEQLIFLSMSAIAVLEKHYCNMPIYISDSM